MKRNRTLTFCLTMFLLTLEAWAQGTPSEPTPSPTVSLEVEKLQLEIERSKLENQRLELQIKTLQMSQSNAAPGVTMSPTATSIPTKKDVKQYALDMASKSEALAKECATDENKVILDFSNGEIWYKGVRSKLNDFHGLCSDEKWNVKGQFVKYDINGDSMERYQYKNMYLDKYDTQSRGVFVYEAPVTESDFVFITPETVSNASGFGDFRNHFETEYFSFDKEYDEKDNVVLRFKRPTGFLGFDDVLEFWFDKHKNFVRLKWGMLDKK